MKNLVSILLILVAFTLNVDAQTRTFNTKVKLKNLVESQPSDKVLTINANQEVSSISKSDLVPEVPPAQTLSVNGQSLSITGGNSVTLPTAGESLPKINLEAGYGVELNATIEKVNGIVYIHIESIKKIIDDIYVETAFNIPSGYTITQNEYYTAVLSSFPSGESKKLQFFGNGAFLLDTSTMVVNQEYYADISYVAE